MQLDCYTTLLYDHDNRYHFSFSFSLQKLLQHCMYLYGHANKAGCCFCTREKVNPLARVTLARR